MCVYAVYMWIQNPWFGSDTWAWLVQRSPVSVWADGSYMKFLHFTVKVVFVLFTWTDVRSAMSGFLCVESWTFCCVEQHISDVDVSSVEYKLDVYIRLL